MPSSVIAKLVTTYGRSSASLFDEFEVAQLVDDRGRAGVWKQPAHGLAG